MSEDRLVHLASYLQLPPKLQSVVKLALLHGIPGPKAVALLNLPNPTRTWESERVQAVVAAYGNPDLEADWVRRLESVQIPQSPPALEPVASIPKKQTETAPTTAQDDPSGAAAPAVTPEYLGFRPTTAQNAKPDSEGRCAGCGCVLCACYRGERKADRPNEIVLGGESGVNVSSLFPGITAENTQYWRQQVNDEQTERERLIGELLYQQNKNSW
jgi:hypothetical protein